MAPREEDDKELITLVKIIICMMDLERNLIWDYH